MPQCHLKSGDRRNTLYTGSLMLAWQLHLQDRPFKWVMTLKKPCNRLNQSHMVLIWIAMVYKCVLLLPLRKIPLWHQVAHVNAILTGNIFPDPILNTSAPLPCYLANNNYNRVFFFHVEPIDLQWLILQVWMVFTLCMVCHFSRDSLELRIK